MRATRTSLAATLAAAVLLTGCGGSAGGVDDRPARADSRPADAQDAAEDVSVTVETFMFQPDPVEVDAGETVTWTNRDSTVHTVTSGTRARPDGRFDDRLPESSSGTSSHRFDKPGRYPYFCSLHSGPGMEAVVIVR